MPGASSKVSLRRGPYTVKSYTGVWVDRGQAAEQQQVPGVRVDGGVAVTMTEERDW